MTDVAELELHLKVANTQVAKLEHRVTHLLSHIEQLEETNRQQCEYTDRVIDKLNEVMMDVTGLFDSYQVANALILDIMANKKMPSTSDIKLQSEFEHHLEWIMETFENCLERHKEV